MDRAHPVPHVHGDRRDEDHVAESCLRNLFRCDALGKEVDSKNAEDRDDPVLHAPLERLLLLGEARKGHKHRGDKSRGHQPRHEEAVLFDGLMGAEDCHQNTDDKHDNIPKHGLLPGVCVPQREG